MTVSPVTLSLLRLLEHLHGHLGWLTVAVLFHPAILLRPRAQTHAPASLRRCDLAVGLAIAFVTSSAALGVALYPEYRARIRTHLFEDAPSVGWLFERKEHLAFGALVLAWSGALAYVAARRTQAGERRDPSSERARATIVASSLGRAAFLSFVMSAAMATVAACLGIAVAVVRTF